MHKVHIGTSGWAYPSWKPDFYPAKTPSTKLLDYYSTQLNCVEVNYTFRARPAVKTLQNWATVTPDGFTFVAKAHQRITHFKRLKDVAEDVREFGTSLQPLFEAGRLGPVLFQLPPNLKASPDLLTEVLRPLPRSQRFAMEFRHASWFEPAIFDRMRDHNVALCIAENEDLQTPEVFTADFSYFRFRYSDYTSEQLQQLRERVLTASTHGDVFAFMKHEDEPRGALNARKLLEILKATAAPAQSAAAPPPAPE